MEPPPVVVAPAVPALLELHDLVCARGGRALFGAQRQRLGAGQMRWLRGTNGSGKTTLLRTLAGLAAPLSGSYALHAPRLYLAHANALKDDLTVQENLQFAARLQGAAADSCALDAALQALDLVRLRRRAVRQLSQGQRRRAALARLALPAPRPGLWLLDEPFDALDETGIQALVGLIERHCAAGGALLYTSHQAVATLAAPVWTLDGA